jgi:hypothetical protein
MLVQAGLAVALLVHSPWKCDVIVPDVIVPDVLAAIYSMDEPVPVARLAESVWESVRAHFDVDSLSPLGQIGLRGQVDNDVAQIFDAFEGLGALTSAHGVADAVFAEDLDEADGPFSGERAARLRKRLAEPGRLVSLTPLGTRAMRQRMLAEGREAGLVGELAGASPAEVLGTVAEHYPPGTAAEEIAIWRAAHGGSLDPLVQAIRDCSFVSRRVALLQTLVSAVPEGDQLLAGLVSDPVLGPVVLLAEKQDRRPDEVSPAEAAWLMAGSLLELLEIAGPDMARQQLEELPRAQREDVVRAVRDSGYPARETLEDFRVLVAEPILGASSRPRVIRSAPARHARRKRRRGR